MTVNELKESLDLGCTCCNIRVWEKSIENYIKKASSEGRLIDTKNEAAPQGISQVQYEGDINDTASKHNIPTSTENVKNNFNEKSESNFFVHRKVAIYLTTNRPFRVPLMLLKKASSPYGATCFFGALYGTRYDAAASTRPRTSRPFTERSRFV